MNVSLIQLIAAIAMVAAGFALFIGYRGYLARNSERRMRSMLEAVGLDPAIAASGEIPTIMKEVRQRCRSCAAEGVCEDWLASDKSGGNDFCPNARVFEILNKYNDKAA